MPVHNRLLCNLTLGRQKSNPGCSQGLISERSLRVSEKWLPKNEVYFVSWVHSRGVCFLDIRQFR